MSAETAVVLNSARVSGDLVEVSGVSSPTIQSRYENFELLSLFISSEFACFHLHGETIVGLATLLIKVHFLSMSVRELSEYRR